VPHAAPAVYQVGHTFSLGKQAINTVSGEEVSGMMITPRVLQGACRAPSAPAPRMPSRRISAAIGGAAEPGRPMAAVHRPAGDLVPAIFIV